MAATRNSISARIQAVRPPFFTASIIPVLLALAFALWKEDKVSWLLFPLMLLSTVFLQAGTNTINDYYDFKKGIDKKTTFGSSRVLVDGLLTPEQLLKETFVLFGICAVLGLIIVAFRGVPLLIMGAIGILGGYFYSAKPVGLKYRGLGDISVFILMGPLLVVSAYYAITGIYNAEVIYASLPVGFLVAAILHANNLRDIVYDKSSGIKTVALTFGLKSAKAEYHFLLAAAFVSVLVMVISGVLPLFSLGVFISLPFAVKNMAAIAQAKEDTLEKVAAMDIRTAQLHMAFGMLLILSLFLAAIFK